MPSTKKTSRKSKPTATKKKKLGRPTEYRPEFCEKLIEHFREGYSYESFGAEVGVSFQTVYAWEKKHKAFLEAKKKGRALQIKFWEKEGRKAMWGGKAMNPAIFIFTMKNICKWSDSPAPEADHIDSISFDDDED